MIDYIKLDVSHLDRIAISENENLNFQDTYDRDDGVVHTSTARYCNLKFTIVPTRIFMEGSLHKYYNIRHKLGNQNHTQFSYNQILWVINDLQDKFRINPEKAKILNIEYGVNIGIDENPTRLLQSKVMFYKSKYPNFKDYRDEGYILEFSFEEYKIKMYDKGSQYHLDQNILRFEVRTKKSRVVGGKVGIQFLADLCDTDNLINLHSDLKEKMNDLYIYDCINPNTKMTKLENHLFTKSQSKSFFHSMEGPSKYNRASKAKTQIKGILSKYNLNTSHKVLIQKLDLKRNELLQIAC